jgi:hypothetical protein
MGIFVKVISIAALLILLFSGIGCRKDPDPEPGFSEPFYVSFTFQDENLKLETADVETTGYWSSGPITGWANHFGTGIQKYDVELSLELDKRPAEQSDIEDLEGKTITIAGSSYPRMKFYLVNNQGVQDYATGIDLIDYGESSITIDQVIKGPKININGDNKRSYILRGEFSFNISKSSWSSGEQVVLYPVTDGQFSIRVYLPSE